MVIDLMASAEVALHTFWKRKISGEASEAGLEVAKASAWRQWTRPRPVDAAEAEASGRNQGQYGVL